MWKALEAIQDSRVKGKLIICRAGIKLSLREGTVFVQKNPLKSHLVVKR